jgi:hypothetical protein
MGPVAEEERCGTKIGQGELGWRVKGGLYVGVLARRKSKEILARKPPVPKVSQPQIEV